ncbi:hypothetical protein CFC21_062878 [Triticum aestivum]|uniref:Uncharacterized protein n=2 Tax=Triticum aestivum TaxID=4565 RepID=A0A9R1GY50_WHEAT|nr:hypothetical protein CFC21_062878 [Triticum aestivum]
MLILPPPPSTRKHKREAAGRSQSRSTSLVTGACIALGIEDLPDSPRHQPCVWVFQDVGRQLLNHVRQGPRRRRQTLKMTETPTLLAQRNCMHSIAKRMYVYEMLSQFGSLQVDEEVEDAAQELVASVLCNMLQQVVAAQR